MRGGWPPRKQRRWRRFRIPPRRKVELPFLLKQSCPEKKLAEQKCEVIET